MKKYQIKNTIGSGNFSTVYRAEDPQTHETYAVKIMKTHPKIALREAHFLNKMKHPNVIELLQFQQNQEQSKLLFEHVGINTLQLYESHSYGLREEQVKCILFQTALGLAYIHSFGIIHRDIKPQNLLIDKKNALVKIIDFGLAISQQKISTDYIATRWYRAPENLLSTKQYTTAIDVFSLGCVIVELYLGSPLFPGSNNMDQLYKIFNILGQPNVVNWPLGYKRMMELGVKANTKSEIDIDLKSILNPCDLKLVDLIHKMLILNPKQRITCEKIVKHEYFKDIKSIIPPPVYQRYEEDFLKPSVDPLSFKGFHQIKNPKLSIVKSIGTSKSKYSAHKFRSVEKVSRKEKNESLDSFHSSQNKKGVQPSIIRSVEMGVHEDSSKYAPRSRFLTNANSQLDKPLTISNNKLNFDYKSKIIKNDSYVNNNSIQVKESPKLKEAEYSKNSTEDTAGQRTRNFLNKLSKTHQQAEMKMKKLNPVKEKSPNEKKLDTSNKKLTFGLRTDRSPQYIDQIKNTQPPKMVRVPENKNSSPVYRGNISPSSKFNYNKVTENTRKNADESYRYGSPKNVYISPHMKRQKASPVFRNSDEGRKVDYNPGYMQQNKIHGKNYQGKMLSHYRSYDNLSNEFGYPQRHLRKSPEITSKNYPTNFNKYNHRH